MQPNRITSGKTLKPLLLAAALLIALAVLSLATTAPAQAVQTTVTPLPTATLPPAEGCQDAWFFTVREAPGCPDGPPIASDIAVLAFERGIAYWVGAEATIYILYRDWQTPYWESYPDTWLAGSEERDPDFEGPLGLWQQPRRGIGEVWRDHPDVRERLGWALTEWEDVYTGQIQHGTGPDGEVIYLTGLDTKAIQLPANGGGWDLFSWLG